MSQSKQEELFIRGLFLFLAALAIATGLGCLFGSGVGWITLGLFMALLSLTASASQRGAL